MPQFVILHHRLPPDSGRADHFDLMLEDGDSLLTWTLPELPSERKQQAEALPPHRRDYLIYEGPVSNGRGEVERVAAGTFEWIQREQQFLVVQLTAESISGRLTMRRCEEVEGQRWLIQVQ